jgi:hypothetical protein
LILKNHFSHGTTRKNTDKITRHTGTTITRKVVNSLSRNALCFSVFRVIPWQMRFMKVERFRCDFQRRTDCA